MAIHKSDNFLNRIYKLIVLIAVMACSATGYCRNTIFESFPVFNGEISPYRFNFGNECGGKVKNDAFMPREAARTEMPPVNFMFPLPHEHQKASLSICRSAFAFAPQSQAMVANNRHECANNPTANPSRNYGTAGGFNFLSHFLTGLIASTLAASIVLIWQNWKLRRTIPHSV
jgi:hypothetical protein